MEIEGSEEEINHIAAMMGLYGIRFYVKASYVELLRQARNRKRGPDQVKNLRGMVLSAGLGTRLRPLTYIMAKPAVPFLGRPLIHYSLDMLTDLGIRDIAVNLHHLPETVEAALQGQERKYPFIPGENHTGHRRLPGQTQGLFLWKYHSPLQRQDLLHRNKTGKSPERSLRQ